MMEMLLRGTARGDTRGSRAAHSNAGKSTIPSSPSTPVTSPTNTITSCNARSTSIAASNSSENDISHSSFGHAILLVGRAVGHDKQDRNRFGTDFSFLLWPRHCPGWQRIANPYAPASERVRT